MRDQKIQRAKVGARKELLNEINIEEKAKSKIPEDLIKIPPGSGKTIEIKQK